MSFSRVLAISPNRRPATIIQLQNSHGWSPSIWGRLLRAKGHSEYWMTNDTALNALWKSIEELPGWQQVPLVLTFDTGVIPFQAFPWAADQLEEFEKRLPAPDGHVNHVPAVAEVFRSLPEAPLIGTWGTSVSENPFDPWDSEADAPGSGIPLAEMYLLERHRELVPMKAG